MRFPLGDYLDAHVDCRHNLGESGMRHALGRAAVVPRAEASCLSELRLGLAHSLGVATNRVVLTHGASEANAWTLFFLARRLAPRARTVRVRWPEYPPLVATALAAGFRVSSTLGPSLSIVSRPRNPEGDLWSEARLREWTAGSRHVLIDETFREFAGVRSVARDGRRGLWTTGTFTKFYGADDLRVGFAVAPPEEAGAFEEFAGLVTDEMAPSSAAGALRLLHETDRIRARVRALLERNRRALRRSDRFAPRPVGPVYFDRTVRDGTGLARRALRASVLVCPGRFFGEAGGVRVGMTRRSFPEDLKAYLAVRERVANPSVKG